MSNKLFRAVIAAVLLALVLSVSSPSAVVPPAMLATECGTTASG